MAPACWPSWRSALACLSARLRKFYAKAGQVMNCPPTGRTGRTTSSCSGTSTSVQGVLNTHPPDQAGYGPGAGSKHLAACLREDRATGSRTAEDGQQCLDVPGLAVVAGSLAAQGVDHVRRAQGELVEQECVLADYLDFVGVDRI